MPTPLETTFNLWFIYLNVWKRIYSSERVEKPVVNVLEKVTYITYETHGLA
jgi:hypothetical protein